MTNLAAREAHQAKLDKALKNWDRAFSRLIRAYPADRPARRGALERAEAKVLALDPNHNFDPR